MKSRNIISHILLNAADLELVNWEMTFVQCLSSHVDKREPVLAPIDISDSLAYVDEPGYMIFEQTLQHTRL